jgi:threonine dehydrogenase-like Zn-dependent dehydrogenase
MSAVRFHAPGDLRVDRVSVPEPGPGDLLLRVGAVGICATDQKIAARGHFKIDAGAGPRVLGHEVAGEIVAAGDRVQGLAPGTRVAVVPNLGCGRCRECVQGDIHLCADYDAIGITLDGGMAEYLLVPERAVQAGNVLTIPADLLYPEAAMLEPLACCYNSLAACRLRPGSALLIVGAGPMGLMHVALGRAFGAAPIIVSDILEVRLPRARQLGADFVIDASREDVTARVQELTGGRGADAVVIAAGAAEAQAQAVNWAARKGSVNFFASLPTGQDQVSVPANRIHYQQINVTGTTGANVTHFHLTLQLLAAGRVDAAALVTARQPLAKALPAFEQARLPEHARVVLEPGNPGR